MCLISHRPVITTMERALQAVYTAVFRDGIDTPLTDLIEHLMCTPDPDVLSKQASYTMCCARRIPMC